MDVQIQQRLDQLLEELLLLTRQYNTALRNNAILDDRKKLRVRIRELQLEIDHLKQDSPNQ